MLNRSIGGFRIYTPLYAAGNLDGALIKAQKLEAAVKARFGERHVAYAEALYNLAIVYDLQSKYGEAGRLTTSTFDIIKSNTSIGRAEAQRHAGLHERQKATL